MNGQSPDRVERHVVLHDRRDEVDAAQSDLFDTLASLGYGEENCFAIRLALEEALVNAFKHGNKSDPDKPVRLDWWAVPHRLVVEVEDQGEGFDPESVPDPTLDENIEIPSGRGIMLMRAYMSEISYKDPGNRVIMVFERRDP
ncbi:MAG: ATP-binding protein [Phycisphaerales bacterium]|nr:ATP-binding protein [Phycisphaerales bacterium]